MTDEPPFRSGFAAIVGRPNVGKSTLVNRILGRKVSIVAASAHTTRFAVRGVLDVPGHQLVLVDTPGIHRPRSALGTRLNETATASLADPDTTVLVVEADAPIGRGDRYIAARCPNDAVVVVNKIDVVSRRSVLEQLRAAAAALGLSDAEYFPVSARTGAGVPALVEHLLARLPEGPRYFPPGTPTDLGEDERVAELVREQLLRFARDELPHSIACQVTEREGPRIRCEIVVERPSQKAIVIGRRGENLRAVGTAVRAELPPGTYLELFVRVERDWQRRDDAIRRLGY